MTLMRFVGEGEMIPKGYAVAYRDFDRDTKVAYPLILHLLVRWARDFRFWLMSVGRPGYREEIEREWWRRGYREAEGRFDSTLEHYTGALERALEDRDAAYAEGRHDAISDALALLDQRYGNPE